MGDRDIELWDREMECWRWRDAVLEIERLKVLEIEFEIERWRERETVSWR